MNKGFTLVEVIAVVAILSIIAIIAGVSYTTINNKHNKTSCENIKKQLENTAIEYVQDNNLLHNFNQKEITYEELKEKGYMEEKELINPVTKLSIPDATQIEVTLDNSQNYSATADLECN